jgi:hypothetical protein
MNWQAWLTVVGVGAAGLYLAVRLYRTFSNRSGCCSGCGDAPPVRDGLKREPLVSIGTPPSDVEPPPPTDPP